MSGGKDEVSFFPKKKKRTFISRKMGSSSVVMSAVFLSIAAANLPMPFFLLMVPHIPAKGRTEGLLGSASIYIHCETTIYKKLKFRESKQLKKDQQNFSKLKQPTDPKRLLW